MPRVDGTYAAPHPDVIPDTTIESDVHNDTVADLVFDANFPRPVIAGGTGGVSPTEARANLSAEVRGVVVTNYDNHVFEVGSFFSQIAANAAPNATDPFVGICLRNSVTDNLWLSAVSQTTGVAYTRRRTTGGWGAWEAGTAYADTKVSRSGDTMTGALLLHADPTSDLMAATKQYVDLNFEGEIAFNHTIRSRAGNGAMQISQENSTVAGTTTNYYGVDRWVTQFTTAGAISVAQVVSPTPRGSSFRLRVAVTTPDATLETNDHLTIRQGIEGRDMTDFLWGTASAKPVILRFGWRSPAGTYSVALLNNTRQKALVKNFTVLPGQANTDVEFTMLIPGDTTISIGYWPPPPSPLERSTGIAMALYFGIAGGALHTVPSTVDTWQTGTNLGIVNANNTNGLAATGVFELFDVGLYLDTNNTGVPPVWQLPDLEDELLACQRYWYKTSYSFVLSHSVAGTGHITEVHPTEMVRKASPSVVLSNITYYDGISTNLTVFSNSTTFFMLAYTFSGVGTANMDYAVTVNARI